MKKRIGSYPRVRVERGGRGVVVVETARRAGLDQAISAGLVPWRWGGDYLADVGMLRGFSQSANRAASHDIDLETHLAKSLAFTDLVTRMAPLTAPGRAGGDPIRKNLSEE